MIKMFPLFKIVFCLVFACTLFIACKHNKKTQNKVNWLRHHVNPKIKMKYLPQNYPEDRPQSYKIIK